MKAKKRTSRAKRDRGVSRRLQEFLQRATIPVAVFMITVGLVGSSVYIALIDERGGKEYEGAEAREKVIFMLANYGLTGEVLDEVVGAGSTAGKDKGWYYAFRTKPEAFDEVLEALLGGKGSIGIVEAEEVEADAFGPHWDNAPEWWCPRDESRAVLYKVGENVSDGVPFSGIDLAVIEETKMVYLYRWSM